ncbi:hypothetical protein AGMMS49992_32130 [Clostridia bacterium]|nr:hypothetical protein AGMMS49992_32130 [Clostridia bacterium]
MGQAIGGDTDHSQLLPLTLQYFSITILDDCFTNEIVLEWVWWMNGYNEL